MAGVITKRSDFDSDRVTPAHVGFTGTASANATSNIDYKVTADSVLDRIQLIFSSSLLGDKYTVQIVDKDNALGGGANIVVASVFNEFNVDTALQTQVDYTSPIPIAIPANTYIRVRYTATALLGSVGVKANVFKFEYRD